MHGRRARFSHACYTLRQPDVQRLGAHGYNDNDTFGVILHLILGVRRLTRAVRSTETDREKTDCCIQVLSAEQVSLSVFEQRTR